MKTSSTELYDLPSGLQLAYVERKKEKKESLLQERVVVLIRTELRSQHRHRRLRSIDADNENTFLRVDHKPYFDDGHVERDHHSSMRVIMSAVELNTRLDISAS